MKNNYLQNMIVLKNLPSNLVEEAIVVLKQNKKAKKYQYIDEKAKTIEAREKDDNYIVKEAENVINNYITKLEMKSPKWKNNMKKLEKRYKISLILNGLLLIGITCTVIIGLI